MDFSVVFEKASGRIHRRGYFSTKEPLYADEDLLSFPQWVATEGMAVDVAARALVPAREDNAAVQRPALNEAWSALRSQRDDLLAQTDYLLIVDYPISAENLGIVKAYRQALRDLTKNFDNPLEVVFPTLDLPN
jgi:hypothetical protein